MKSHWPAFVLAATFGMAGAAAAPPVPGARVFAAPGSSGALGLHAVATRVSLRPPTSTELMAGAPANTETSARALTAIAVGHSLRVDAAITVPPLPAVITRELDEVWRYVPDPKRITAERPGMRVELRSPSGERGTLALRDDPRVRLPVAVQASQVLRRDADGLAWYEGRVVLEIPVAAMRAAGTYTGRLEISQESL
ncbi:MAG: hypothetical protein J0L88_07975 [Xanthomonadales bacterium]|nr:hypothetical protein [Xanthomonadales bacterium]